MAYIEYDARTDTAITVYLAGLDSSYGDAGQEQRKVHWYLDGELYRKDWLINNSVEDTSYRPFNFTNLHPGTPYEIYFEIEYYDLVDGWLTVTLEPITVWTADVPVLLVTDITENSITVEYIHSDGSCSREGMGWCYYGENFDDVNNLTSSRKEWDNELYNDRYNAPPDEVPYCTITDLRPNTTYYLKGRTTYNLLSDSVTEVETVKTLPSTSNVDYFIWSDEERDAFTNNGFAKELTYERWNILVDKVKEILTVQERAWNAHFCSYEQTKADFTGDILTAERFNSLKHNVDANAIWTTGIEDVSSMDEVLGSYFLLFEERINAWIDTL